MSKPAAAQDLFVRSAQTSGTCPVKPDDNASTREQDSGPVTSECPVNPRNVMPLQSADVSAERTDPSLSTDRAASTIPVAQPESLPEHQKVSQGENGNTTWLYPSEKMFYSAMKRKGWTPASEDMKWVVSIHNVVNERAWQHILQWERLHSQECNCPKLIRFQGKPKDYSPRARLLNVLGYTLPFDRHDWYVDRCGQEVRYVIDFYSGDSAKQSAPAAMYLDVRPALDSFGACFDRARMSIVQMLSWW